MQYIKEFLALSLDEQQSALSYVATQKGLPLVVVEKDLWVTIVLHILFGENGSKGILFKGGTSLSKGFNLIDRFSEDIDVTYSIETLKKYYGEFQNPWNYFDTINTDNMWSNKKLEKELKNLKDIGQKYTDDILLKIVEDEIKKIIDLPFNIVSQGEMTLYIYYPKLFEDIEYGGNYIQPMIKIEAGVRSARVPTITKKIDSFFEQILEKSDPIEVEILRPDRTFWEKATILHAENSRNEPSRIEKRNHLSRHIYDLVKLFNSEYGKMAIDNLDLLNDVVKHKSTFYKDNKADYPNATPQAIKIVPTPELNQSFKLDYEDMAKSMIIGNPPSYEELLQGLNEIEKNITQR
ncbi:MAG: nucleotidyl transferase AbiEii/AbiGii toxin family protein [Candidatus Cloacimonetes bacterium]|nr:nucleotidyl transferase AbiEii/AbiGii toxin family protein [Candidatus Cloacimonadota bacterium]